MIAAGCKPHFGAPALAYHVTFGNVLHRNDVRGVARQGVGYASERFLALQEMK